MTAVQLGLPRLRIRDQIPPAPGPSGTRPGELVDRFGRIARDLRVSLTDRCNLRCGYCMPPEGLPWTPAERLLSDEEVIRVIRLAVQRLGIRKVRFTGGEPLLRKGLERIVSATSALSTDHGMPVGTALTTNALGLSHRAAALREAGLGRVNVSLDTLRPERFAEITRRDRLSEVLAGLAAARAEGLGPVKVNAVLLRGINDDEAVELLEWALEEGHELRFIEAMPLDAQGRWQRDAMVTAQEILARLAARYTLSAESGRGAAPAERFVVRSHSGARLGRVGVIASVTRPFCGDCDRARLTADGQLRNCLFAHGESDLRTMLRAGADDDTLARLWQANAWAKRAGHGIDDPDFRPPERPMSAIGG